jgi:hypothetical protein
MQKKCHGREAILQWNISNTNISRYPEWNISSIHTINDIYRKLWASGIWNKPNRCHSISVAYEANEAAVLATVVNCRHLSTGQISWMSAGKCQSYPGTPQISHVPPVIASRTTRTWVKRSTLTLSLQLTSYGIIMTSFQTFCLLMKPSSQSEEHALLVYWKASRTLASGPSTAMESKRLMRHYWLWYCHVF